MIIINVHNVMCFVCFLVRDDVLGKSRPNTPVVLDYTVRYSLSFLTLISVLPTPLPHCCTLLRLSPTSSQSLINSVPSPPLSISLTILHTIYCFRLYLIQSLHAIYPLTSPPLNLSSSLSLTPSSPHSLISPLSMISILYTIADYV